MELSGYRKEYNLLKLTPQSRRLTWHLNSSKQEKKQEHPAAWPAC